MQVRRILMESRRGESTEVPHTATTQAERVYHYTDAPGLVGLVTNKELWASSPLTLNDSEEMHYGLKVFVEAWRQLREQLLSDDVDTITSNAIKVIDRVMSDQDATPTSQGLYVVCASTEPDSLNQWQGYANRQGYAVGIASWSNLAPRGPAVSRLDIRIPNPAWHDVIYNYADQLTAATDLLKFLATESADVAIDFGHFVPALLARFKHPAFSAEREVRFICGLPRKSVEHHRAGVRGVTPYVKVAACGPNDIETATGEARQLPIVEIRCAPTNPRDTGPIEEAVRRLCAANGLGEVEVNSSAIPYRF